MYLRFAADDPASPILAPKGVFNCAYALRRSIELDAARQQHLQELLEWFHLHLPIPRVADLSDHALFWLKSGAPKVERKMWQLVTQLRLCDVNVQILKTKYPGKVTYEDDYQVAAVPRSATRREVKEVQRIVLRSLRFRS